MGEDIPYKASHHIPKEKKSFNKSFGGEGAVAHCSDRRIVELAGQLQPGPGDARPARQPGGSAIQTSGVQHQPLPGEVGVGGGGQGEGEGAEQCRGDFLSQLCLKCKFC